MSYDKRERMAALEESDEVFNAKMQKGLDDARNGSVTPWTTLSKNSSSASHNGRNTGEYKKNDPLV